MSSFVTLIALSVGMFVSTFVAGTLPLVLPLSRRSLRYVELLGAGLLIGAAFTVVIPEGVGTLLQASFEDGRNNRGEADGEKGQRARRASNIEDALKSGETIVGFCLLGGFFLMFLLEQLSSKASDPDSWYDQSRSISTTRWQYEALSSTEDPHTPVTQPVPEGSTFSASASPGRLASSSITARKHNGGSGNGDRTAGDFVRMHRQKSMNDSHSPNFIPAGRLHRHSSNKGKEGKRKSVGDESISSGECGSLSEEEHVNDDAPRETSSSSIRAYGGVTEGKDDRGLQRLSFDEDGLQASDRFPDRPGNTPLLRAPTRPSLDATLLGHSRRLPSVLLPPRSQTELEPTFRTALASILGLLIHAAADGIAMGASVASSDTALRWIIFAAILIHKTPASFGLCSVLLSRGLSKRVIAKALLIFSLCTPTGAILTYIVLKLVFHATSAFTSNADLATALFNLMISDEPSNSPSQLYIGSALTFSGGTFLFVAMHALDDVTDSPGPDAGEGGHARHSRDAGRTHNESHTDAEEHGDHPHTHPQEPDWVSKPLRIALLCVGALIPKALQIATGGHSH